jgi:hypothetical protein
MILLVDEEGLEQPSNDLNDASQQPLNGLSHLHPPTPFPQIAKIHIQGQDPLTQEVINFTVELVEAILDGIHKHALR